MIKIEHAAIYKPHGTNFKATVYFMDNPLGKECDIQEGFCFLQEKGFKLVAVDEKQYYFVKESEIKEDIQHTTGQWKEPKLK